MLASLLQFNLPFISLALQDYFCPSPIDVTIHNQKQYLVLYIIMKHTAVNFQTTNTKKQARYYGLSGKMWSQENQSVYFYHSVISETYLHLLRTLCIFGFENIPVVLMKIIFFSMAVHCLNS